MHNLLQQQINNFLGSQSALPEELALFLAAVNETYEAHEAERMLTKRSHEWTIKELGNRNIALRTELEERQRAEAQLENLLSLLGTTLESTADGILVLNKEAMTLRFNQSFAAMWRVPDEILAFWKHASLMQHILGQLEAPDAFMEKLNELCQHPEMECHDTFDCIDGRIIERYSMPQPLGVDNVGRVLSFRDITASRQAEEALRREKEEQNILIRKLEETHNQLLQSEKMASIGQLAAGVAHEINNPIGFVHSNLGTLERYVRDIFGMIEQYAQAEGDIADEEVRNRLQAARKKLDIDFLKEDLGALMNESKDGIVRVKQIVQNLKDFSHVDATDEWRYADLHKGLDSTLNIVHNEVKYKANVIKEYGDLPEVECLPSQLNQVFMNLLVNAAHAIEERGTITIRTGRQGNEVWVEVADTGKGIPPENLTRIFDPFFTTKPVGKGTGLGLSLSYGIIQKHHGRIEVQSEVGKGTSFKLWLPVNRPQVDPC